MKKILEFIPKPAVVCFYLFATLCNVHAQSNSKKQAPNFIIIFADDLGYADLSCFGAPLIKTPRLDQMAREGMKFTNFYAQTVCGPSRASLMTGCYPMRVAKEKNTVEGHPRLDSSEVTVAEVLKKAGYQTGCIGKWHLAGHSQTDYIPSKDSVTHPSEVNKYSKELLPRKQGFDYFFGTPSSNDFYVNLIRNDALIEEKADLSLLTQRYTDTAISFIEKNKDQPFFLYIAHSMPHKTLAATDNFKGKSPRGLYGDVISELDFHIGRLLDRVRELHLDDNTYVIFTSDNGPWLILKENGGGAFPLRGGKTSTWEGGLRVPCIVWSPGNIPAGYINDEVASTLDVLPTFAKLGHAAVPKDRIIDGHDISKLLAGKGSAKSPTRVFYYYQHTHLQAVRAGKWKLMLSRSAQPAWCPPWASHIKKEDAIDIPTPMLFDLSTDVGEQHDVATQHPDIVKQLLELADKGRNDIGDYDRIGKGARFVDAYPRRPDIGKTFAEFRADK